MDISNDPPHFLLATMPYQSHLNPTLHLARRLIHSGVCVTVATTIHGHSRIKTFPSLQGLAYASFSDGFDEGTSPSDHNQDDVMYKRKHVGSQTLTNLLQNLSREGNPVTFLIYGMSLSWAADVARAMSIPSAFLFIQAAALVASI
ncbi:UDP-glucuronosyl/UDP-glucosyltransferase [Corchorus capsularis]|uniref:UDP-glucuronosyl/UDP-glucosyltransferase n=1 Tax=Corchorus capsularis TaxID=210143 RepID=A0A1R3HY72_COCAP|nr:UDP-glucuronosyl/UDP-glucosyltransferase [Corchorus capsularis]